MTASPTSLPTVPFAVAARKFHVAWIARARDEDETPREALIRRAYHAGQALVHGASEDAVRVELHRFLGTYRLRNTAQGHVLDIRSDAADGKRAVRDMAERIRADIDELHLRLDAAIAEAAA